MTMPDVYPNPDEPRDGFDPLWDELAEYDDTSKELIKVLLSDLHLVHDNMAESDQSHSDAFEGVESRLPGVVIAGDRHGWEHRDESIMPYAFMQYRWTPRPHTSTAVAVDHIWTRRPIVSGPPLFDIDSEHSVMANDVFIEVVYKSGGRHRYLVNGNGIFPYSRGEAIDGSDDELYMIDRDSEDKPNLFTVIEWDDQTPLLAAAALRQMTLGDSTVGRRPIDPPKL